jgi:hypothetical protein
LVARVASGLFKYPFMTAGPRAHSSPLWYGPNTLPVFGSTICTWIYVHKSSQHIWNSQVYTIPVFRR